MPNECEGIQGFPTDWTLPKNPPDDVDKLDTFRYTALGNAVSVPVVQWIAQRIRPVLERYHSKDGQANLSAANGHDGWEAVPLELALPQLAIDRR